MASSLFCCPNARPYRPRRLDHEAKFTAFVDWVRSQDGSETGLGPIDSTTTDSSSASVVVDSPYAVQLVRRVNFGPKEWIRYFIPTKDSEGKYQYREVREKDLVDANFEKLNS